MMTVTIYEVQGETYWLSKDKQRAICHMPFGIACYERIEDQSFRHYGVVGTAKDAERWLLYKKPKKLVIVYGQS